MSAKERETFPRSPLHAAVSGLSGGILPGVRAAGCQAKAGLDTQGEEWFGDGWGMGFSEATITAPTPTPAIPCQPQVQLTTQHTPGPSASPRPAPHPGGTCARAGEEKGLWKTPLLISNSPFQV